MSDDRKHHLVGITRRALLRNAGIAGAAAAVGVIDVMATPASAEAPVEQIRTGLAEPWGYLLMLMVGLEWVTISRPTLSTVLASHTKCRTLALSGHQ